MLGWYSPSYWTRLKKKPWSYQETYATFDHLKLRIDVSLFRRCQPSVEKCDFSATSDQSASFNSEGKRDTTVRHNKGNLNFHYHRKNNTPSDNPQIHLEKREKTEERRKKKKKEFDPMLCSPPRINFDSNILGVHRAMASGPKPDDGLPVCFLIKNLPASRRKYRHLAWQLARRNARPCLVIAMQNARSILPSRGTRGGRGRGGGRRADQPP